MYTIVICALCNAHRQYCTDSLMTNIGQMEWFADWPPEIYIMWTNINFHWPIEAERRNINKVIMCSDKVLSPVRRRTMTLTNIVNWIHGNKYQWNIKIKHWYKKTYGGYCPLQNRALFSRHQCVSIFKQHKGMLLSYMVASPIFYLHSSCLNPLCAKFFRENIN